MVDLGLRMKGSETILTREYDLNQVQVQESVLIQKLVPNQKIEIHIIFPSMEWDFPKSVDQFQALQVQEKVFAREMGPNHVRTPELTQIQKLKLNHNVMDQVHIHNQVQFP